MNKNLLIANSDFLSEGNFLEHHQILGAKWGQRNGPPYPLNKKGKESFRKRRKAEKLQKQQEAKKAAQEKREASFNENKDRIMKSGSATEALAYKGMWTENELRSITNRIDLEKKLSGYAQGEIKTTMDKIEGVANTVGRMTDVANKTINAYNVVAKVYNATQESNKSDYRLPLVNDKAGKAVSIGAEFSKLGEQFMKEEKDRREKK